MTLAFYLKKIVFFWRHAFRNQNSHLWNTTVSSLEHNSHIFGTQLSHLWNTTVTSLEHNRHIFGTQRAGRVERSLITTPL